MYTRTTYVNSVLSGRDIEQAEIYMHVESIKLNKKDYGTQNIFIVHVQRYLYKSTYGLRCAYRQSDKNLRDLN